MQMLIKFGMLLLLVVSVLMLSLAKWLGGIESAVLAFLAGSVCYGSVLNLLARRKIRQLDAVEIPFPIRPKHGDTFTYSGKSYHYTGSWYKTKCSSSGCESLIQKS